MEHRAERFSGIDSGNYSFSWVGKIKGTRSGFLSLAVVNGDSTVTVSFADGVTYSYRGDLKNIVLTRMVSSHKVCGGCVAIENGELPPDPRMGAQPMLSWQNGDANLIDLLVVYPGAVRSDAGGTSAIQAEIIKAVADTNLCYQNSKVNVQLRLVHMEGKLFTPPDCLVQIWTVYKASRMVTWIMCMVCGIIMGLISWHCWPRRVIMGAWRARLVIRA